MTLGEKILLALNEKGINQAQLADILDVKPATVSSWISGRMGIKKRRMPALANALDKEVSWFLDKSDNDQELRFQELEKKLEALSASRAIDLSSKVSGFDVSFADVLHKLQTAKHRHLELALAVLFENLDMISNEELSHEVAEWLSDV